MSKTMENLSYATRILGELLSGNPVGKNSNKELYDLYINDTEVENLLTTISKELFIEIYDYEEELFLSPGVNNRVFGYSNDEIKKKMRYGFDNSEMYLAYFVMMVIITMFYKESDYDTHVKRIRIEDILLRVSEKMDALKNLENLSEISTEMSYNFEEIVSKWESLSTAQMVFDEAGNMEFSDKGKNSKYPFINAVCDFMEKEDLIKKDENMKSILPQKRFKAIVYCYFQDKDCRNELYDFIKKLNSNEEDL